MSGVDYTQALEGASKTVTRADGSKLHTVALGSGGRPVLLAHGYGFTADEWNLVAPSLAERGLQVIAFDQRGHGRSTIGTDGIGSLQMASDYGAILEAYAARNAILVGHSMGGFLGITFLVERLEGADRVGAALLMATFAGDVNRENPQNRLQIPLIKSGILVKMLGIGAVGTLFTKSLTGDDYVPGYADAFVPTFRAQDHRSLVPILQALVDENRYDKLGEIDLPCTVVVGSKDATTPPFHTADLHAGIPGSSLVTLDGKGHSLNWEAPEAIVEEIVKLAAA